MLKLFSVFDAKLEAFIQPFYELTTAAAVRAFTNAANEPKHNFKIHGEDYSLFELGTFDQEKGTFSILESPKPLGLAITMQRRHVEEVNETLAQQVVELREELQQLINQTIKLYPHGRPLEIKKTG